MKAKIEILMELYSIGYHYHYKIQRYYLAHVKCRVVCKVPKKSMEYLGIAAAKGESGLIFRPSLFLLCFHLYV